MSQTPALHIGPITVSPPVVLAPMAGITNPPFRALCRRFGGGLFVSEMITARGLADGASKSWDRAAFDPDESPRSIQLYGSEPASIGRAVQRLVGESHVDHIDLNLGCPVRKITRHGGGAALTARPRLVRAILDAAVASAGPVPITAKFRLGIDDEVVTFLDVGRIAEDAGCAAIALHGRSAAQLYSGVADWSAIAALKEAVTSIPVLGNGDIWSGADALRMMRETGCDGVVVGRGCLGRPWLFRDLDDVFAGRAEQQPPDLATVIAIMIEHAEGLARVMGEPRAMRDFRKHTGWYLTGYPVGGEARRRLGMTSTIAELASLLQRLDGALRPVATVVAAPRGAQRGPQVVTLPDRWLDDRDSTEAPDPLAGVLVSGG